MILTLRTKAVSAGLGSPHGMVAVGALDEQLARERCAASADRGYRIEMTW